MQFKQFSFIRFVVIFLIIHLQLGLFGQEIGKVVVDSISFSGNNKTRTAVLERELTFKLGDSLDIKRLSEIVEFNRLRILNTNLFSKVEANIGSWNKNNSVTIHFKVLEQWYLTGYPIFDLADRNFNVWWTEQGRKLNRVNYGFRIGHENLTGNADELTAALTLGYTQKVELEYTIPGINKARTLGMRGKILFSRNPETSFQTFENKFLFHRSDEFQLSSFVTELGFVYRKKLDVYHGLDMEFHNYEISDTIANVLNPDYFLGSNKQKYFALEYNFTVDKRVERPYTKKGWYLNSTLRKEGIGIFKDRNALILNTTVAKYFQFSDRWTLELIGKGYYNFFRSKQPYRNNRALGDEPDYLRGYELYVIDGLDYLYLQSSLRFQVLDWEWNFKLIKLFQKMRLFPIPIQVYLVAHNDIGYANEPYYTQGNPLSNSQLWGRGFGVDVVAYYDLVLQIQYSFNHLAESGIFLHSKYKF